MIKYVNGNFNDYSISPKIRQILLHWIYELNYSQPIYDDKYIKTNVKTFSSMINTLFSGNEIPKERNHYIYIAAICIDSVLRVDKKNYPQAYSEQCKYNIK